MNVLQDKDAERKALIRQYSFVAGTRDREQVNQLCLASQIQFATTAEGGSTGCA